MKLAIWLARLIVAGVFLYAGIVKAGASEGFAVAIAQFSILPQPAVSALALALPFVEIAAGVLLVIPRTARLGAGLAAALLCTFLVALGWALSQGLIVDCGCFGDAPPSRERMVAALARDVILLALTLLLAARPLPGRERRT